MRVVNSDIREYKNNLRNKYKELRRGFSFAQKLVLDDAIFNKITSLDCYKKSELVITFVSTPIEVDTQRLIEYSLKVGKKVAVPKCIDGTRLMDFYLIESLSDLEPATFNVLEPIIEKCIKLENFENSICIVPGLAFDLDGYRLGYGKGYYDRFLSGYTGGEKIGVCYCCCTANKIPRGRFDKAVNLLITEKFIRRINKEA